MQRLFYCELMSGTGNPEFNSYKFALSHFVGLNRYFLDRILKRFQYTMNTMDKSEHGNSKEDWIEHCHLRHPQWASVAPDQKMLIF